MAGPAARRVMWARAAWAVAWSPVSRGFLWLDCAPVLAGQLHGMASCGWLRSLVGALRVGAAGLAVGGWGCGFVPVLRAWLEIAGADVGRDDRLCR